MFLDFAHFFAKQHNILLLGLRQVGIHVYFAKIQGRDLRAKFTILSMKKELNNALPAVTCMKIVQTERNVGKSPPVASY